MAKVCISGYYGYDSVDHELTLMTMVNSLRRQDENMDITVFSAAPAKTEEDFDVVAVDRNSWDQIHKEMASADVLIVGGGLLMKETADLADIKYYIKMIKMALRMKMPVFVFHQTFEPYTSSRAKKMVGNILQKVRKITVADNNSVEVLHEMGIRRGRIHVTESPILTLTDVEAEWRVSEVDSSDKKPAEVKTAPAEEPAKEEVKPINYDGMDVEIEIRIVEKKEAVPVEPDKTIVIENLAVSDAPAEEAEAETKMAKPVSNRPLNLGTVVPSFWKKPGEKFAAFVLSPKTELPVTQITAMADHMIENGYQVVFIPVSYPEDITLGKEILKMMKHTAYEVDAKLSPQSFYTAINEVDFVFTNEIYPMMIAAVCKKPFTSLCCTEKDLAFVTALGLTPTGNLMDFNNEAFVHNFKAAVSDPAAILSAMEENLPALQESAAYGEEQFKMLFEQIRRRKDREARGRSAAPRRNAEKLSVSMEDLAPAESAEAAETAEAPVEEIAEETAELTAEDIIEEPILEEEGEGRSRRKEGKAAGKLGSVNEILEVVKAKVNALVEMIKGLIKGKSDKKRTRRGYEEEILDEEVIDENIAFDEVEEDAAKEEESK